MPTGSFRPGDRVPITGVYTATHYQHRLPHDVFAVTDDLFLECRRCGMRVSFSLSQASPSIVADQEFTATRNVEHIKKKTDGS